MGVAEGRDRPRPRQSDVATPYCPALDGLRALAVGAVVLYHLGVGWLPVSHIGEALLWAAALLTLVTGWDYLRVGLRHMDQP